MTTNQIMKREFGDDVVEQRTKDGFFNATQLMKISISNGGKKIDMQEFFKTNNTKDFMYELTHELNTCNNMGLKTTLESDLYEKKRGRGGATWMHPYLFVKFAMWLSPKFEVQVIKWICDNLIDYRNQAGDYFKEMCATIQENYMEFYSEKPNPLVFQKEARYLNMLVTGSVSTDIRNTLDEKQLNLLNGLQKLNIALINAKKGVDERKRILRDYSDMYRIANY